MTTVEEILYVASRLAPRFEGYDGIEGTILEQGQKILESGYYCNALEAIYAIAYSIIGHENGRIIDMGDGKFKLEVFDEKTCWEGI
jgi:hypothetical protein